MSQSLALISLVVPDYDEAIDYYVDVLGFELVESPEQASRIGTRPAEGSGRALGYM